ncbi:MAG: hypothetical protein J6T69_08045 [Methanobrevibacter sp.]|nr:hypothetical protein [Methanobrevibacter sp.]
MIDKRFTLVKKGNGWVVDDNSRKKFYLTPNDVVRLLNNLHQENQQLKHYKLYEDNKRLQTIIADLKDDKNQLHKVISKLRQEVAELKTRNSVLSSKLNQIPKSIKEVWLE